MNKPKIIVEAESLIPSVKEYVKKGDYPLVDSIQLIAINLMINSYYSKSLGFLLADGAGLGKTMEELVVADYISKVSRKRALIVTESDAIIKDSFIKDGEKLNIDFSNIELGTYHSLARRKIGLGAYSVAIFDEAHNFKNAESLKTMSGNNIVSEYKVFATATPMDTIQGTAYFLREISGMSEDEALAKIGFKIIEKYDEELKAKIKKVVLNDGVNVRALNQRIANVRDELISSGNMIRRIYPLWAKIEEVKINVLNEDTKKMEDEISNYWDILKEEAIESRNFNLAKNFAGQRSGELNRFIEPLKIPSIEKIVLDELKDPKRKVVIIAEGVNETEIKSISYKAKGFINTLYERLSKKGFNISKGYGTLKSLKIKGIEEFQKGGNRIILGTYHSLSTGIDLDDQVGDEPRTLILVTVNFSGNKFQQALGRISRRNTKSESKVIVIYSDTIADGRRKEIIEQKLETLRAIQEGRINELESDAIVKEYENNSIFNSDKKDIIIPKKVRISENVYFNSGYYLIPYKNSLVLYGDTYKVKEQIKEFGGKFNKYLDVSIINKATKLDLKGKYAIGWIMQKDKLDLIIEVLFPNLKEKINPLDEIKECINKI